MWVLRANVYGGTLTAACFCFGGELDFGAELCKLRLIVVPSCFIASSARPISARKRCCFFTPGAQTRKQSDAAVVLTKYRR